MGRVNRQILNHADECLASRRVADALRLFCEAERLGCDPDACAAGRWTCHMLAGNFPLAWRESEAISRRGGPDPHRFWDGRPVDGRNVLIRCLHGLGDTIQFIRYVPLIRARARSVAIEAQPPLKALLAHSALADCVITWGEPEPPWDQQIEVVELPRIFCTALDSIPSRVPYLNSGMPPRKAAAAKIGCPAKVGIVWASSDYNPARSVPLRQMARLFSIRDISFFSLQAGGARFDLAPWRDLVPDLHHENACVLRDAQSLCALDLIVTVDTMMAHLAGSLARPVWTLLPFAGDWRWMLDREDSPWYPSMRLFRQPRPGDWDTVIDRVRCSLQKLLADPSQSSER
ncbi:MAG: ADP-heptose--LPS heptosyltransferase [Bryobacteraceae bacterium]